MLVLAVLRMQQKICIDLHALSARSSNKEFIFSTPSSSNFNHRISFPLLPVARLLVDNSLDVISGL